MGIKGSATCVLNFDDATGYMIGSKDKGLNAMFTMMNLGRIVVGIQGLGISEIAYQNSLAYAKERKQGKTNNTKSTNSADFIIECLDGPLDIENAIIDKLGKNDIKWESLGEMHDPRVNRITYEEVIDATTSGDSLQQKEGSRPRVGAGAS